MRVRRPAVVLTMLLAVASGVVFFLASRGGCEGLGGPGRSVALNSRGTRAPSSAQDLPPVQVLVTKLVLAPNRVMYRYTMTNGSAFPITTLIVGFDKFSGVPQLTAEPIGWDGETVPAANYESPSGWQFVVRPTEEDPLIAVKWEIGNPAAALNGGASLGGFAVVVDRTDSAYENGMWMVYLSGEAPYFAQLQPSGVTSVPISSVFGESDLKVSPNPTGGEVAIRFATPTAGKVTVDIFDVAGRRVRRIVDRQMAAGASSASWDGKSDSGKAVGSGVYFIRVKTSSTQRFARITWLPSGK